MRLLVCGDRHWDDNDYLFRKLDEFALINPIKVLIEGEAPGADIAARSWARLKCIEIMPFPADWQLYSKAAGPIRNRRMINEGKPDLVMAFHKDISNSRGTANMLRLASLARIKCILWDGS